MDRILAAQYQLTLDYLSVLQNVYVDLCACAINTYRIRCMHHIILTNADNNCVKEFNQYQDIQIIEAILCISL